MSSIVWLILFSITSLKPSTLEQMERSYFFMTEYVYILYPFFINQWILCFPILDIINNASVNIWVHISLELVFLFSQDKYQEVKLLDCMVVLISFFEELQTAFIVVAPIYNPTNNIWGIPFIHILANTSYFLFCSVLIV